MGKHLLMLLNDGADPNAIAPGGYLNTAIHIAGINGHGDLVTALAGWPHTDINVHNYAHQTPLHYAAEGGNAEAVRAILDSGRLLEVSPRDAKFETPLHFAANHGFTDVRPAIRLRTLTTCLRLSLNSYPVRSCPNVSPSFLSDMRRGGGGGGVSRCASCCCTTARRSTHATPYSPLPWCWHRRAASWTRWPSSTAWAATSLR